MVTIIIYVCEALIVLSLLMMLGFGLRGLFLGQKNYVAIASMVLPLVVFVICMAMTSPDSYAPLRGNEVTSAEAGIVLTAVVMFGLAIFALLGSAVRGFFR